MPLPDRRLWAFAAVVAVTGAGVLAACSSSSGGDDDDGTAPDAASDAQAPVEASIEGGDPAQLKSCQDYVDAYCAKQATCGGGANPSCESMKASCPSLLFANGSTLAPSDVSACSVALAGASCLDFYNNPPASCAKPGTRNAGASCAFGSQCQSGKCVDAQSHCGYCARIADDGENCNSGGLVCAPGKYCDVNNSGTCVAVPAPGAHCNIDGPDYVYCPAGLDCARMAGQTQAQATCQPRAQAGQPCNVEPDEDYLYCAYGAASCNEYDASTNAGTCIAYGNVGDVCGDRAGGVFVQCNASSAYCQYDDGGIRGTCAPLAPAGAPCGSIGESEVVCDGNSYCESPVYQKPGTCVARKKTGDQCGAAAVLYVDGGASGEEYSVACGSNAVCTNYFCYFSNRQDGGPAKPMCVIGNQSGQLGDSCGHGQCDTCATTFACIDHVCTLPDLSSCN